MSPVSAGTKHASRKPVATTSSTALLWIAAAWLLLLAVIFVLNRENDLQQLPTAFADFTGGLSVPSASAFRDSLLGALAGTLVAISWIGFGSVVRFALQRFARSEAEPACWQTGTALAYGAGVTSLAWFFFGLAHLFRPSIAILILAVGLLLSAYFAYRYTRSAAAAWRSSLSHPAIILVLIPIGLASLASLAPPVAKDTLLYHISLPKAYVAAGGFTDVPLNIAQYYALGAEMNGTWAMLIGKAFNMRVAEAAFGFVQFAYLPILALITFGWMRKRGQTVAQALLATAVVVTVPTLYSSAISGYNDVALAVYVTLAIAAAADWWRAPSIRSAAEVGLALGFALTIKLLAVFLIAPLAIMVLLKLRESQDDASNLRSTAKSLVPALLLAIVIAAPWYARTWARTGSPVFPFYMNIFHGSAPGWDEQRSLVDQLSNARYGGYPKSLVDYALVPLRVSLTAQPDEAAAFDGVVGFSFLFGIPLVILSWKRKQLSAEWLVATVLAASWFFFWMFSSEQIRYLLPALPALACAIVAASSLDQRLQKVLWAATVLPLLVVLAWFFQRDPLSVITGAESRDHYLSRSIDHYSTYAAANSQLPQNARVWLIDVRGDTYYIERPYLSEFRIEHTFPQLVLDASSVEDLRARVRQMGVTHLLVRTDILLNYQISQLVDDRLPAAQNEQRLQLLHDFMFNGKVLSKTDRFVLMEL